jgi:hypothetical protein
MRRVKRIVNGRSVYFEGLALLAPARLSWPAFSSQRAAHPWRLAWLHDRLSWQSERTMAGRTLQRFQLDFKILTNDALESARTGNWFAETPLAICRLDKLSRNEDVQAKLANTDWDLVVCDEAHNMSATFFGNEVKYTKSYRLGQLLGQITRHLLLMTATPHNGKQEDFQLFMALLDSDRFEGRTRDGVHTIESFFVAGSGMDELTKSYGVF